VARTTANIVRWQCAIVLAFASLASPGQPDSISAKPSQADRDLSANSVYQPITARERWKWFVQSTIGPQSLAGGVFSAGFGTATDSPHEYRGTWEGFGKRYGMRLTGVSTGNTMEAGFGALWGEDPRYFRAPGRAFSRRVQNIVKMTFIARRPDGDVEPAYARYIAIAGNNFLSNTWRTDSEADTRHAVVRTI
jgi:hypothetical protein